MIMYRIQDKVRIANKIYALTVNGRMSWKLREKNEYDTFTWMMYEASIPDIDTKIILAVNNKYPENSNIKFDNGYSLLSKEDKEDVARFVIKWPPEAIGQLVMDNVDTGLPETLESLEEALDTM